MARLLVGLVVCALVQCWGFLELVLISVATQLGTPGRGLLASQSTKVVLLKNRKKRRGGKYTKKRSKRSLRRANRKDIPIYVAISEQLRLAREHFCRFAHFFSVYEYAGKKVKVIDYGDRIEIEQLDEKGFRAWMPNLFRFLKKDSNDAHREVNPPLHVVQHLHSTEVRDLRRIDHFASSPFVTKDGDIVTKFGYHGPSKTFSSSRIKVPPVSKEPSKEEVAQAIDALRDVFCDFPVETPADFANLLGGLLTMFAQQLFKGRSPLFAVLAPSPGTGKTLVTSSAVKIATGEAARLNSFPTSETEVQKVVTAAAVSGQTLIIFDNVRPGCLSSPAFALSITAEYVEGRLLGKSEMIRAPNAIVVWLTGNGLTFSRELVRRTVPINLCANVERPEQRDGFKHEHLLGYIEENRPTIVHAVLTTIRAWFAAGCPKGRVKPLASFEDWSWTIGGILDVAGVEGFLGNLQSLYEGADDETSAWVEFYEAWYQFFADDEPLSASRLLNFALSNELLLDQIGGGSREAKLSRFGKLLKSQEKAIYGGFRIVVSKDSKTKANRYTLKPAKGGDQ